MSKLKPGEFEVEGIVLESLPNLDYRVQITQGPRELIGSELLGKISGQMKMFRIKVMPGDGVRVLMTKYDLKRGRITYRMKEVRPLPVAPTPVEAPVAEPLVVEPELKKADVTVSGVKSE